MGRQPYHAEQELIMSNAMDVLDAQTLASAAEVIHWNEQEMGSPVGERFWRQTFDVGKLGKDNKGGLSVLKKHCVCQQPYNPDTTMYQCKNSECHTWNHEACLLNDIRQRSWDAYKKGTLSDMDIHHVKAKNDDKKSILTSLGKYVHDKVKPAIDAVIDQSVMHDIDGFTDNSITNNHTSPKKKGRSRKSELGDKSKSSTPSIATPWEGKLRTTIIESNDKADEPVLARIEELKGDGSENAKKGKKSTVTIGKKWIIPVQCLVCRSVME